MEEIIAAVRCYNEPAKTYSRKSRKIPKYQEEERVLVLDTETRTDMYQNLMFGSYQVYSRGILETEGLFHGSDLKESEMTVLMNYAVKNDLPLRPVTQFVEEIFLPEVYGQETLCVGFNLPFDLSRLAIDSGNARGANRGGFSFLLSEDPQCPRLIINHVDRKRAFISFGNVVVENKGNNRKRNGSNKYRGKFLDLKTLAFALTSKGLSLAKAGEYFKAPIEKINAEEHGKITPKYINYNRNDVAATYSLYCVIMDEYQRYGLKVSPTIIYSPAGIGKHYLIGMNVSPFLHRNLKFDRNILGFIMATYHGGRSEVKIRKEPTQVALIDFLSMYPTMCILLHIWSYVIASRIDAIEDTDGVRQFISDISLEDFRQQETWTKLNAICLVRPNEDTLPIRAKYGDGDTYNSGLNHVTSEKPVWFSLADVVASKMLTGKAPEVIRAIRFNPVGVQRGIKPITIMGGRKIDPKEDDLFAFLMQLRHEVKAERDRLNGVDEGEYHRLELLQGAIKIICNAVSYGIFLEINTSSTTEDETEEVTVYGNDDSFTIVPPKAEQSGQFFNPIIGTMITSGARLVLAITEALLSKYGETYAFCDTDSMAVPPYLVEEIQAFFQELSPYSFDEPLFKLEKENFREGSKELQPLWFFGISAKRYALYNLDGGVPVIRKASLHGLGHVLNPFNSKEDWHETMWRDILYEQYGVEDKISLYQNYCGKYVISQRTISSPTILQWFKAINKEADYQHQIKPFNFILQGAQNSHLGVLPVKPVAPFDTKNQMAVHRAFIDSGTGKVLKGEQYWKSMDSMFFNYSNHKESKFDGDRGILRRKHLSIDSWILIGKESNNLEETEVMGVSEDDYVIYRPSSGPGSENEVLNETVKGMKPSEAPKYGLSKRHVIRLQKSIKNGEPIKYCKKTKIKLHKCKKTPDRKLVDDRARLG